jgi:hypothetical protein
MPLLVSMDMLRQCYQRRLSRRVEFNINQFIYQSRLREAMKSETFHIFSGSMLIQQAFRSDRREVKIPKDYGLDEQQIALYDIRMYVQACKEVDAGSPVAIMTVSLVLPDVSSREVLGYLVGFDDEIHTAGTEEGGVEVVDALSENHRVVFKQLILPTDDVLHNQLAYESARHSGRSGRASGGKQSDHDEDDGIVQRMARKTMGAVGAMGGIAKAGLTTMRPEQKKEGSLGNVATQALLEMDDDELDALDNVDGFNDERDCFLDSTWTSFEDGESFVISETSVLDGDADDAQEGVKM